MIGQEIVKKIEAAQELSEAFRSNAVPRNFNRASDLGWVMDCPRYLCLKRLCPEKETQPDKKQRSRFREGRKQEPLVYADLEAAGFKLTPRGRLTWDEYKLSGEIDREIEIDGKKLPIDVKTCSSQMFKHIERAQGKDDLLRSSFIWIRHYPAQLQAYMMLLREEPSVLLFKDKESGSYHPIDIELDSLYARILLDGIQEVNQWVAKQDPPAAQMKDACDGCGFFAFDFPETDRSQVMQSGIEIIEDPEWLMKLKEYQDLIDAGVAKLSKEMEKIEKEIKEEFAGRKAIVGLHLIESKTFTRTTYDIPQDIKDKYKGNAEYFRTSIKLVGDKL